MNLVHTISIRAEFIPYTWRSTKKPILTEYQCVETLNMLFFWKGKARFGVPPPQASCLLFNSIKSCRFRKLEETEFPHGLMTIAELFSALAIF